jgi:hypothetical protein
MNLKGADETAKDPVKEQDDRNENDEFKRVELEQELKKNSKVPNPAIWP